MYQTILVPLDGSPLGERALAYLPALAGVETRLVLLRLVPPLPPLGDALDLLDNEQRRADRYLREAANRIAGSASSERRPPAELLVRVGDPAPEILRVAAETGADLIVMATHSRAAIGRWLFGSVADEVSRRATTPVMLVPPSVETAWSPDRARPILVPLDGTTLAEVALAPATTLADALGAELILLRAVPPPEDMGVPAPPPPLLRWAIAAPDFDPGPQLGEAESWLEEIASVYRTPQRHITVRAEFGTPAAVVAAVAHEQDAAAIVIATHARHGLARTMVGSVATALVERAAWPILVLHAPGAVVGAVTADAGETRSEAVTGAGGAPAR